MSKPFLRQLNITHVRNLRQVKLDALDAVNVFYGANGSGKTSILEAIHLLGLARSFRGNTRSFITHGETSCTVFGQFHPGRLSLGVQRNQGSETAIRVNGQPVRSLAELANIMPLQVINAESFELLNGPPAGRRRFLDWGVFHVEHTFFPCWKRYQRGLKQRNMLLRRGKMGDSQLAVWTREVAESGELLSRQRQSYFESLSDEFEPLIGRMLPGLGKISMRLRRGWDRKTSLGEALEASIQSDLDQGFTHVGPQRADIRVEIDGRLASEVLSRGQQKLVVCAMKLAQGRIMSSAGEQNCTYLVDDLPSELDQPHAKLVCEALAELKQTQVFITCVEAGAIESAWPPPREAGGKCPKMFHVEHGTVTSVA